MERIKNVFLKVNAIAEEIEALFTELNENNQGLKKELATASNAYFADITVRESKIKGQLETLEMQKEKIFETLEKIRPALVEATTAGNEQQLKEIQEKMAELKAQEAAIDTQIEFLYTTPITGNNELFDIATDIANKFDADIKLVDEAYAKLLEISKEQMKIWEKLYDKAFYHNKFDTCREYERACEYHNGPGKCVERPKEESSNIKSEPINMETGRYIFGQDPNYRQSNSADNIKSMGPRMD